MAHHTSGSWPLPIPLTLLSLAAAILYLRGCRLISKHSGAAILFWRVTCFFVGLVLLWMALGSPLAGLDHQFLTVHMVQHLLLMTIAPAFILLGDPLRSLSHGWPSWLARGTVSQFFRWPPLQQFGRFLANPIVCWLSATGALIIWHVPAIFALAMQSQALHLLEHATFLFAGVLFWWPVIQPWPSVPIWPRWPILLYLFLATIPCDILSAYLTFCDTVVYPSYFRMPGATELSILRDQQLAGSLMWTCVTIVYLVPAAILSVRLLDGASKRSMPSVRTLALPRTGSDSSRTQ